MALAGNSLEELIVKILIYIYIYISFFYLLREFLHRANLLTSFSRSTFILSFYLHI